MARKRERWLGWEDHLNQVLIAKPAEVVQEACQVLEKHGCSVKKLKSELYYSSTLHQVVFQVLHYRAKLIVSKYVAESITMIAGRFGHEGLCQLRTELKKLQCEIGYIANTGQWCGVDGVASVCYITYLTLQFL